MIIALLCLAFPRLLAIICAGALRLCFRAMMAIVARVLQEMWAELRVGLGQISLATSTLEETLLLYLQDFFSDAPSGFPQVPFAAPTPTPGSDAGGVSNQGGASQPTLGLCIYSPPFVQPGAAASWACSLDRGGGLTVLGWCMTSSRRQGLQRTVYFTFFCLGYCL